MSKPPEILFLQVRHPITRLISAWDTFLCETNCKDAELKGNAREILRKTASLILNESFMTKAELQRLMKTDKIG
jgi:hypothetical protein